MARPLRLAVANDEKESQEFFVETRMRLGHDARPHRPVIRFNEFRTLQTEARDLKQALEKRKTIDPAKGTLMKRKPRRGGRVPSSAKARQAATTESLPKCLRWS